MDRARDFELTPKAFKRYMRGQLPVPPPGGAGMVGRPTLATEKKGELIYRRIIASVRTAVFLAPAGAETDTV
jgi:hypothetical protein